MIDSVQAIIDETPAEIRFYVATTDEPRDKAIDVDKSRAAPEHPSAASRLAGDRPFGPDRAESPDAAGLSTAIAAAIKAAKLLHVLGTHTMASWSAPSAPAARLIGGTIRGPVSPVDFLEPSGSFLLSDVTLDRWASALKRELTDGGTIVRALIENSRFTGLTSTGLNFEVPTDGLTLQNSSFASNSGGYSLRIGTNDRALEDTWQRGTIAFNRFEGVSGNGSSAAPYLIYGRDHLVIGNVVDGVTQRGAGEAWGGYAKARHSVFAFGNIRNVDSSTATDITGHSFKGTARSFTGTSPRGFGSLAIGYTVRDIGAHGVRGIGIRAQTTEFQIANSFVENPGLTGIVFDEPDGDLQASIANRVHFTTPNTPGTLGIRMDTGGFGMRSLNDQVYGAYSAFRVSAGGGSVAAGGAVIDNALIGGGTYGVIVNTRGLGAMHGLTVSNVTMQSGAALARFDGGPVRRARLLDNDLLDTATELTSGTIPADCQIRHTYNLRTTGSGKTATFQTALPDNASFAIQMTVTAVQEDGADRAMYVRQGIVYRDGGAAMLQGGALQAIGRDIETDASWSAEVITRGDSMVVEIAGDAARSVQWKVRIEVLGVGA